MRIECFHDGTYASNCYLITNKTGSKGIIIDPSVSYDFVFSQRGKMPKIEKILLTHAHFDHVLKIFDWREKTKAKVCITKQDVCLLNDGKRNAYSYFFSGDMSYGTPDILLYDGSEIPFGEDVITTMITPGHTAGSCCFLCDDVIFTGDTIFAGGCVGRTDLFSGNQMHLWKSIKKIFSLNEFCNFIGYIENFVYSDKPFLTELYTKLIK